MACNKKNAIALFLFLVSPFIFAQKIERGAYPTLDTEKKLGLPVSKHMTQLLDSIFEAAESYITFAPRPDKETAYNICKQFSDILKDNFGFKYKNVQIFSHALEKRILDCNYYSLLFYTLLNKKKHYEVYPIFVPGHMFIRWYFSDGSYINYETTTQLLADDSLLRSEFIITPDAEKRGLYMSPLSDSQMTALHYAELAYDIADTNRPMAISISLQALQMDSLSIHVYRNLSTIYYLEKQVDLSDYYFSKALQLDSLNYTIYSSQGEMYLYAGDYGQAGRYFTKAIEINPDVPSLYMYRCYNNIKRKALEEAMSDFERANALIDKKTFMSFFVNYFFLHFLDEEILKLIQE
ncbi:MAG: Tetratricopeptide repeat protein [Bacteroidetes bacterium ADurb.Bin408]|nr:MAG: Tetratricopeptide repeat protein [Bacteroidetes bacterium ADurb.Bin408]